MHYVLVWWFKEWQKRNARGYCGLVVYADDFAVCFQYKDDAERFYKQLGDPLARTFPKSYTLIIGLVVHAIDAKSTTSQSFPGWCFDHYCGMDRVVSDSEVSKLYKMLGKDQGSINVFFTLFAKSYGEIFPSKKRIVGFDSTNQNSSSAGIDLAKRGHAKRKFRITRPRCTEFQGHCHGVTRPPCWRNSAAITVR